MCPMRGLRGEQQIVHGTPKEGFDFVQGPVVAQVGTNICLHGESSCLHGESGIR